MEGLYGYLRQNEGLVDIFLYDQEKPLTGYVAEGNSQLLFIKRITGGPHYDGGTIVLSDMIARIHRDSRALLSQERILHGIKEPVWPGIDLRSWQALLNILKISGDIVSVVVSAGKTNKRFVGKIQHMEEDIMGLESVGSYDDPDLVQVYLKISDIQQVSFGRKKDKDLFAYNLRALGPG